MEDEAAETRQQPSNARCRCSKVNSVSADDIKRDVIDLSLEEYEDVSALRENELVNDRPRRLLVIQTKVDLTF